MKRIFSFLKQIKNKLNIKLIDILLEAEKPQLPKDLKDNLDDFFKLFDELKFFEKILVGIIFCTSTVYMMFWIWKFYSLLSR